MTGLLEDKQNKNCSDCVALDSVHVLIIAVTPEISLPRGRVQESGWPTILLPSAAAGESVFHVSDTGK